MRLGGLNYNFSLTTDRLNIQFPLPGSGLNSTVTLINS